MTLTNIMDVIMLGGITSKTESGGFSLFIAK